MGFSRLLEDAKCHRETEVCYHFLFKKCFCSLLVAKLVSILPIHYLMDLSKWKTTLLSVITMCYIQCNGFQTFLAMYHFTCKTLLFEPTSPGTSPHGRFLGRTLALLSTVCKAVIHSMLTNQKHHHHY